MEGPLLVCWAAGVDGVVRDMDLETGGEQIECSLENADVGLDAGDDDLFSPAVFDCLTEALVASTRECELSRWCLAEDGGEALDSRTETLRVLLAGERTIPSGSRPDR